MTKSKDLGPPEVALSGCHLPLKRVNVGPVSISQIDGKGALATVDRFCRDGGAHFVCFCEANLLACALSNPQLVGILKQADLVLPDGVALLKLAALQGTRLPGRVPGPAFMLAACGYGLDKGWRHFFYGGAPGIAQRLAANLRKRYPTLQVAGVHSPPFRPLTSAEEARLERMVAAARPDLFWVGLGGPKQEFWMAAHRGKIPAPVMLGVGAAFDFHSGQRPWAPRWVRNIGMEWLFRMFTGGPRTFWRNCWCVSLVACLILPKLIRTRLLRNRF